MGCKPLDAFQEIGTVSWFGGRARYIVPLHAIILGRFYRLATTQPVPIIELFPVTHFTTPHPVGISEHSRPYPE